MLKPSTRYRFHYRVFFIETEFPRGSTFVGKLNRPTYLTFTNIVDASALWIVTSNYHEIGYADPYQLLDGGD